MAQHCLNNAWCVDVTSVERSSVESASDKAVLLPSAPQDVTRFVPPLCVSKHVTDKWHRETYFTAGGHGNLNYICIVK